MTRLNALAVDPDPVERGRLSFAWTIRMNAELVRAPGRRVAAVLLGAHRSGFRSQQCLSLLA